MMLQNAFIKDLANTMAAVIHQSTRNNDFDVFMRQLIRQLGGYDSACVLLGEPVVRRYWIERAHLRNDGAFHKPPRAHV